MVKIEAKQLLTLDEKSKGLIGTGLPTTLFFRTRFGIHTFFMKYSIDVIVLDESNKVIYLKKNLKPNRIFFWHPKFDRVLEMPKGTIDRLKITKNEYIKLSLF